MKCLLLSMLLTLTMGCAASIGVESKTIPSDAANVCEAQCQRIGLTMTAVAMMADTIGCICQPAGTTTVGDNAGATTAGMATIMLQARAATDDQAQQHQKQPHQQ